MSEKDWSDILCGVGVVGKLATIYLAALLEDEGYEVDATREEEMKIEARRPGMAVECERRCAQSIDQ